jgi:hypothetical protein
MEEDEAMTAAMIVAMIVVATVAMDARTRATAAAPTTTMGAAAEDVETVVTVTANASYAKSARSLAIPRGSAGIGTRKMMKKKGVPTLHPTAWTPTGTVIPVPPTISPVSSTSSP